jgi:acetyl esterase/lipase
MMDLDLRMAFSDSLHSRLRRRALTRFIIVAAALALVVPGDASAFEAERGAIRMTADVSYRGERGPLLDVHRRSGHARRAPAVMVVHGGSWRTGSKRRMTAVSRALARRGLVAFNVDYRLTTPERPGLRRQLDDLRAALRWIRGHARLYGVDPRRIGALGSSAGGHLVSLLAGRGAGRLAGGTRIRAAVTWSAPFDLGVFGRGWLGSAIENLLGCVPADCEAERAAASPVEHVSPDDPPMLIANSRREVIPSAQAVAMADRLEAAGVEHRLRLIDGSRHGVEYARTMLPASVSFLARALRLGRAR